jgi:hypothetical protein
LLGRVGRGNATRGELEKVRGRSTAAKSDAWRTQRLSGPLSNSPPQAGERTGRSRVMLRKILDEKLGIRNTSAHPSAVTIKPSKVVEFIDDLVENVIRKYVI